MPVQKGGTKIATERTPLRGLTDGRVVELCNSFNSFPQALIELAVELARLEFGRTSPLKLSTSGEVRGKREQALPYVASPHRPFLSQRPVECDRAPLPSVASPTFRFLSSP